MSVNVVVNFQALPGKAAELLPLLKEGGEISRAATGCESFELFQRQDDEHKFMFFERWTSIEAHHENMANNILASGHMLRILPLIVGPPDNGVIQPVGWPPPPGPPWRKALRDPSCTLAPDDV